MNRQEGDLVPHDGTDDPLVRLIMAVIDQQPLGNEDLTLLKRRLHEDDDALRCYLEMTDIDARLRWMHRGHASVDRHGNRTGGAWQLPSNTPADASRPRLIPDAPTSTVRVASGRHTGKRPNHKKSLKTAVAACLAAAIAAMVLVSVCAVWFGRSSVGTLTHCANIRWAQRHLPLASGQSLPSGEMSLVQGIAEITLARGARVTVEAPATVNLRSSGEVDLDRGSLAAYVPHGAEGFTVTTPGLRVVDLGTAFGVSVLENGQTEVHVIDGQVDVRAATEVPATQPPIEPSSRGVQLSRGQAIHFNRSSQSISRIGYAGGRYRVDWDPSLAVVPESVTELVRWLPQAPRSVVPKLRQSDDEIILFVEQEGVMLSEPLAVDLYGTGRYTSRELSKGVAEGTISAGTRINSYLLHFDPRTSHLWQVKLQSIGTATFPAPIVGVILSDSRLGSTDDWLGSTRTQYMPNTAHQQTKGARGIAGPMDEDIVTISRDRKTLSISLAADTAADQLRVLTVADTMPGGPRVEE